MKTKARTFTLHRIHPDFTTHQLNKLFGNRQAQPGAVIFAIAFIFDLSKLTKNMLNHIFRNANSGIFDCNVDPCQTGLVHLKANHADQDVTLVCKLYRIADQVGQYLPDTARITSVLGWQEHIKIDQDFQFLVLK